MKKIYVMGIESSCDETSVSIVENGRNIISNVISSQIEIHKEYGGVVPEIASRKHIENINIVIDKALKEGNKKLEEIDCIAVTYGPGLVGALLVGINAAKAISYSQKIPLVPVNHIEGHIYANFIEYKELEPPFMTLIVSGGHTHLFNMTDYGEYEFLGQTKDDAVGEAFDKVARSLGLNYPGGPEIEKYAKLGDEDSVVFPKAKLEGKYDFSFSGLKSSVLNYLNNEKQKGNEIIVENVAASFQKSITDVLVEKTIKAALDKKMDKIVIAGGVSANEKLRDKMKEEGLKHNINVYYPSKILCTDNAAMIASLGYFNYKKGKIGDMKLNANANLKL